MCYIVLYVLLLYWVMNMYVAINGTGNSKSIYIMSSYRKNNGKTSSRIFRKLGRLNDLLPQFDNNEEKLLEWARSEAKKDTLSHQQDTAPVLIPFSSDKKIKKNEVLLFNVGYLFLQSICSNLHFDNICRNIKNHHKFEYDIHRILCDLVYARVLYPSSKRSSFSFAHSLLNSQSINYRISIVPYLYWPRNLITYRRKFIEILTFFIKETQKFFIMTVELLL